MTPTRHAAVGIVVAPPTNEELLGVSMDEALLEEAACRARLARAVRYTEDGISASQVVESVVTVLRNQRVFERRVLKGKAA